MNVFIDAGSFNGDTVRLFRERYPGGESYVVHCFEPDVRCENREPDIILHREAIWTHDGEVRLWIGEPQSSSLIEGKTTGDLRHCVVVPCIDFSRWLRQLGESVVLKLDVEGGEYQILQKMIDDGTIRFVRELFVDWHSEKCGIPNEIHNDLLYALKRLGIPPRTMHAGCIV